MTRRGILLFIALGIIWGIPYLLIKVAVGEISPQMLVLARTGLAALVVFPIAAARGELLPVLRKWPWLLAYTVVELIFPWYFLSSAERVLPSSTAGLLIAAVPFVGVAVAFAMRRMERMGWRNWLGLVLGALGVAALVGLDVGGSDLVAVAEVGIVVVGYAVGPAILARWMSDLPGLGVVAWSFLITAVVYLPLVTATGGWPTEWPSAQAIGAIIALAVVCSAVAFLVFFALIKEIGPVRTTVTVYVNTAVAVAAGVLLLHEPITVWTIVGFVLVISGSWLVTRRARAAIPAAEGAARVEA